MHKKIKFHSFKTYVTDAYKNAPRKINFPNYKYFEDVNQACADFFQKVMTVIDNVAPCKTIQVKGKAQNWFHREVLEKGIIQNGLKIDKELYKKAKYYAKS